MCINCMQILTKPRTTTRTPKGIKEPLKNGPQRTTMTPLQVEKHTEAGFSGKSSQQDKSKLQSLFQQVSACESYQHAMITNVVYNDYL